MILTRITSAMEKCFLDSSIADYPELSHLSALKNERVSFQLLYTDDTADAAIPYRASSYNLQIEGIDKSLFSVRRVESVPVTVPSLNEGGDGNVEYLVLFGLASKTNIRPLTVEQLPTGLFAYKTT